MILALDLASNTGWAAGAAQSDPVYGSIHLDGTPVARWTTLGREVQRLIGVFEPDLIAFEQPMHHVPRAGNAKTMRLLIGFCTVVEVAAHTRGLSCVEVPMDSWRKHFIGRAKAPKGTKIGREWLKAAAMQRCRQLGWNPRSDDEGDALGIWDYVMSLRSRSHQMHNAPGLFAKGGAS